VQYLEAKREVEACRNERIKEGERLDCSQCGSVYECEKIRTYLEVAFAHWTRELKACQASKNLQSCMNCERVFECETRRSYVDITYERLNESRGGEFDF